MIIVIIIRYIFFVIKITKIENHSAGALFPERPPRIRHNMEAPDSPGQRAVVRDSSYLVMKSFGALGRVRQDGVLVKLNRTLF